MPVTAAQLLQAANAAVPKISVADALVKHAGGALLLDVRDAPELQATGRAEDAHHIPRGMLEFRADPATPFHDPELRFDRPVLIFCASGGRAALAGKLLIEMGYEQVYNLGSLKNWKEGGGSILEPADQGI